MPEPATWAIMVLGFGLLGATMRRRAGAVRVHYA
ncbi:MAG TPA: PEPxxWA-CTERM sorting domain-containing protein [Qipengyuania sp.]|nr:PEPxxWA-CTERM sorting domain-containing protein [Qipengyuania sp.]